MFFLFRFFLLFHIHMLGKSSDEIFCQKGTAMEVDSRSQYRRFGNLTTGRRDGGTEAETMHHMGSALTREANLTSVWSQEASRVMHRSVHPHLCKGSTQQSEPGRAHSG